MPFLLFPPPGRLHRVFSLLFPIEAHPYIHMMNNFKILHCHIILCKLHFLFLKHATFVNSFLESFISIYPHHLLWTYFPSWLDMRSFSIIYLLRSHDVEVAPCPSPLAICRLCQHIKITTSYSKAVHLILNLLTLGSYQGGHLILKQEIII